MGAEATLVIIKPDAILRGLAGRVVSRLEELRLEIIAAKAVRVNRQLAEEHYKDLRGKPFFEELLDHIQGKLHHTNYVLAFVFWGEEAIAHVRQVAGATHPEKADPLSLRGSLGRMTTAGVMENILHTSSNAAEAEREVKLWFSPQELLHNPYSGRWSAMAGVSDKR